MTFLAPWALAIGGAGAIGIVLLHLVSRHRPAAFMLPTTRFIPDRQNLVSRAATTPSDLLLLFLRALLLLAAGAAFAKPVLTPRKGSVAQIVLVDRSVAVANSADVIARVKALGASDNNTIVLFDSAAVKIDGTNLDSAMSVPSHPATGSISPALLLARRSAVSIAEDVDSIRVVLVSPVAASEIDSATPVLRAMWPGGIRIERVAMRADSSSGWSLLGAVPLSDPLGPALASLKTSRSGLQTKLVRSSLTTADSAFARGGGTVVRWDTSAATMHPEGLSSGGDVIVATLGRQKIPTTGRVLARWADGAAAAVETRIGSGCVRQVGVSIPTAGDLALHPPFQRIVRHLTAPCGVAEPLALADSASVAMLRGAGEQDAPANALRNTEHRVSKLAQLLLVIALLCAGAELFMRSRLSRAEEASA